MRGRNVMVMSAGQPIKIIVAGPAKSGKTAVIYVIMNALRMAGVDVHLRADSMLGQHMDGRALEDAAPVCTLIERLRQERAGRGGQSSAPEQPDEDEREPTNTQRIAMRCAKILPRRINIFSVACIEKTWGWTVRVVLVNDEQEQREYAGLGKTLADAEFVLYDALGCR